MDWIMLIKSTATARVKDVALFNQWEDCKITTGQCIRWFKKNNRMPDRIEISEKEFTAWLRSLGYIRGNRDEICK